MQRLVPKLSVVDGLYAWASASVLRGGESLAAASCRNASAAALGGWEAAVLTGPARGGISRQCCCIRPVSVASRPGAFND
ncbi:hypothetical protein PSEUDO9AG_41487 [Pseudomonas sp. 9Ag]|nr:hypothetical protein PSEUDO9AG_41487 [Pseudomonas sp. 9Ag]